MKWQNNNFNRILLLELLFCFFFPFFLKYSDVDHKLKTIHGLSVKTIKKEQVFSSVGLLEQSVRCFGFTPGSIE